LLEGISSGESEPERPEGDYDDIPSAQFLRILASISRVREAAHLDAPIVKF